MRLKEDNTSWRAGGIKRRDFRHDPGLPETEIPRHMTNKSKKKKKHVHDYKPVNLGTETVRMWDRYKGRSVPQEVPKIIYVCSGCGNKRRQMYFRYFTLG